MFAKLFNNSFSWVSRYSFSVRPLDSSSRLKPKIDLAILGGRGYHSNYGGVENAVREIADQTVERHKLNLLVYGTDSSELPSSNFHNHRLSFVYPPRSIYRYLGQHGAVLFCVFHILCLTRPTVVLVFASGPCVFVPLLRLFGFPVISSLRAIDSARSKWGITSRTILRLGEYFAWRSASTFTANSMEMIRLFSTRRANATFIPNGSSPAREGKSLIMDTLGLSSNEFLLFAARLDPVKRLDILLQAHSQLEISQRLPLVIAGGHSKSEQYRQHLSSYAGRDVFFLGHLAASDLEPLMFHCRAFLLPSVLEGMSNSLLTAMATGRAVLASDIAPNADLLEDPEALFKADDIDDLRTALLRLCRDPSFAAALGMRLKQHAQKNYSWPRTADMFYTELLPYIRMPRTGDAA